jgi:DNA topoisomerase-2
MASKNKIVSIDQVEHILLRPETYINSIINTKADFYYASMDDSENFQIALKEGTINFGLHRIFVEILSNAIDNVFRSSKGSTPSTKIKVNIDKESGEITVWNDGETILVEKDEKSGLYYPELAFGKLLTGSNFNDKESRMTSGRNGLGSTACNIFSLKFHVKTYDPVSKKQYIQTWTDNMSKKSVAKITEPKEQPGYTEVTFLPDYKRFGVEKLSDDMLGLFFKNTIDCSMITGVAVYWNGKKIPMKTLKDYALMYDKDGDKKEMILLDSTKFEAVFAPNTCDVWKPVSFVNGVETIQGGVHVDAVTEAFLRPVLDKLNASIKKNNTQLTMKDIKGYFRLFLNCKLVNPTFTSQEKVKLASPTISVEVDEKHIKAILKWDVINKIKSLVEAKDLVELKKVEKKTKGFKKIEGFHPANLAGGKKSLECSLILCEGLSASTFCTSGLVSGVYGKSGRDYMGIYPMRGVGLNVRGKPSSTISGNKEISDIISILNLKIGTDYQNEENFKTLSYGRVIIVCDADNDAKHIEGLLINFFHYLFPSLLTRKQPFLVSMRTPLVKVTNGKTTLDFYTMKEFEEYQKTSKKGNIRYLKGLGSHSRQEAMNVFGKKIIEYIKDSEADENINKVFDGKRANDRKAWILNFDPSKVKELTDEKHHYQPLNISDFLNNEMILFSMDDNRRSIPNIMDSFKESLRKIFYASCLKNLKYSGSCIKVAQLAGFVSEKTAYHHGENCLLDTITKMAQDFVGSNNIPYLFREGQFGSRLSLGADAASGRYIHTKFDILTRFIYRPEDDSLLTYLQDDGESIEPEFYVPIIPMILVNGATGIGTGFSSTVLCYNPLDITKCIRQWMKNKSVDEDILPWYRDFTGKIEKTDKKNQYISRGVLTQSGKEFVVSEIPIDVSIDRYKDFLDTLREEKKIKSYKNYSSDVKIRFEITPSDNMELTMESLKLTGLLSSNNMVLFDEKNMLKKYDTTSQIIESFCVVRYDYYVKRKKKLVEDYELKVKLLENKIKFLNDVMSNKLDVKNVDEDLLEKEMSKNYFAYILEGDTDSENKLKKFSYLLGMNIRSFTKQKLDELKSELQRNVDTLVKIKNMSEIDMWNKDLEEFEEAYKKVYK